MFNNWEIFTKNQNWILTEQKKKQLNLYADFLIVENQKYNLTRITSVEEIFEKHFLDSLLFSQEINLVNQKIVDIGTGPGFPGMVLKIFYPELRLTLIESNQKKVNFLKKLIELLKLKDIEVINQRAEDFSHAHMEEYDLVVSRAVASLNILLELGAQLIKIGGLFVALKGPKANEEIEHLKNKDQKLGLKLIKKQKLMDQNFGQRFNLFYQKMKPTPLEYPRKYSVIKKESQ